ncbi:MAG: hypothetical protein ACP5KN_11955, partial [Armatimonadota bacterium]
MTKHGLLVLATIILAGLPAASRATDGDRSMREMRREAAHRTRRIIFNNDGNDAVYQCDEATREELLSKRTTPLADSQVDTIFYCPWSSGFGQFTMRSDVAELFDTTDRIFAKNITGALVEQGTDPLQIMVEWCREHEVEIFWSMRMNDVHDGAISDGQLYYPELFPQFKRDHPEYLIGEQGQRFPGLGSGRCWSGVNYAEQAVRDRAFAIIEDVCNRYDLDGIELDFFRHLIFFRNHATEGAASRQDLEKMTNLLRRVRRMADEVGAARGRP